MWITGTVQVSASLVLEQTDVSVDNIEGHGLVGWISGFLVGTIEPG